MNRKTTAILLIAAAVLTNAAFTVPGSVFSYPDILKEPTNEILASFPPDAGSGHVLVWPSWPSPPHCSPRSLSASAASRPTGRCAGPSPSASRPRPSRSSASPAGPCWYRASLRTRPAATRRPPPRAGRVRNGPPGARQPHRREPRLPVDRGLDAAGPRRPAPRARRSLVHRPRAPCPPCSSSSGSCPRWTCR